MKYQINRNKYLSEDELEHLQAILENDNSRNGILLKVALATGARAQEVLNIEVNDLNDKHFSVFIRGLKGSKDREIPLSRDLYAGLKNLITDKSEKLFPIAYRTLLDIWYHYRPVKKKFHSLRHTFAIETYKRTKDSQLVKAALGHRSFTNTDVYLEHLYETELLKKLLK